MIAGASEPRVANALDDARRAFLQNTEERRLRLFRACLQASVGFASPLALSFARRLGLSLDDVFQAMTPPPFWPQSTGPLTLPRVRWDVPTRQAWRGGSQDRMMWRILRTGGHTMRIDNGGSWVGWRMSGDTVEVAAGLGSATLVTNRGTLRLWLPHSLPATLCAAMSGRPLASLVLHPYLADDDLAIASIDDHRNGGHVLRVRAGKLRFAAPWPGQLAGLLLVHAEPSLAPRYLRES